MPYRYFIQLSFDGTRYNGWQVQENAPTVQAAINAALTTLLREPIATTGAGRTDTGVHARRFFAHFDSALNPETLNPGQLVYKLNRILPPDIAVQRVFPVNEGAHARFSAISRTYHYMICSGKDPFYYGKTWLMERSLHLELMQEAANLLPGQKDFAAFSKSHSQTKTSICKVSTAKWHRDEHLLLFEITADRFLRNMVRAITGTLVEVGLGKRSVEEFRQIIQSKDRQHAGYSAPACGLYLVDIVYPTNLAVGGEMNASVSR